MTTQAPALVSRARTHVGRPVHYNPTAAQVSAYSAAGPYPATVQAVNSDGTVDLLVQVVVATPPADAVVTAVADASTDGVLDGMTAIAPTTPSGQLTGGGNTTWSINVTAGDCTVDDKQKTTAVQTDFAVHSGSNLLALDQCVYAWLVEKNDGGTVTTVVVKGTPAARGAETIPSDADIDTGVSSVPWIKLALLHLDRTGDTTLVQTQDITYKQMIGDTTALANDLKAKFNAAVTTINALNATFGPFVMTSVAQGDGPGTFRFV